MIRLIVNADDFGLTESVNAAVLQAYERGILTSCSLMVAEPAAASAVQAARERPGLAVGLHLTAVCGRAALPASEVPRVVDRAGRFSGRPVEAGLRYTFDREARAQLARELRAQFERFQEFGLPLSHVDGHLHFHMHPVMFDQAVVLAEELGCRRIRIPHDDWSAYCREEPWGAIAQAPMAFIFALLARRARRRLAGRGFVWAESVRGFFRTGRMNEAALLATLRALPPGVHEIYSHPDAGGRGQERSDPPAERAPGGGEKELAALLSPRVRRLLEERGIQRITYRDLETPVCR